SSIAGAAHYWSAGSVATATATAILLSFPVVGGPRQRHPVTVHPDEYQSLSRSVADALQTGRYTTATTNFTGAYVPISIDTGDWAELLTLGHNWDGSGAEPVSREAIKNAQKLVASLGARGKTFEPFAHPN